MKHEKSEKATIKIIIKSPGIHSHLRESINQTILSSNFGVIEDRVQFENNPIGGKAHLGREISQD